jgi:hypothetical protein
MRDGAPGSGGGTVRRRLAVAAALGMALAAPPALAQERDTVQGRPPALDDPRLAAGRRIRVTLRAPEGLRLAGRIDSVVSRGFVLDTTRRRSILFIAPGPELLPPYRIARVRYEDIARVEASRGTSRRRGAVIGGLIGAAVGGVLTGLSGSPQNNPTGRDVGGAAVGGIVVGGLVGGVVGYAMGRERWEPVAWP